MNVDFIRKMIDNTTVNLHTAYIAKVISVGASKARVQPLTYAKSASGELLEQAIVTAYVPPNVKYQSKDITYVTAVSGTSDGVSYETETVTVLEPVDLEVGDIVYCGVCERDISYAVNGVLAEPSKRRHDMNDSVILGVM